LWEIVLSPSELWGCLLNNRNSSSEEGEGTMGMNSFGNRKFHAANGKAQHALMNDPIFSL
jgi:hypothetical protein